MGEAQLDEFDALSATYDPDELTFEVQIDGGVEALRSLLESGGEPPKITIVYTFTLTCEGSQVPVTLQVQIPHEYPVGQTPVCHAQSDAFTRDSGTAFMELLKSAVQGFFEEADGAAFIFRIVEYVKEEAAPFLTKEPTSTGAAQANSGAKSQPAAVPAEIHRAFVSFHHMLYGNEHKKEQKVVDLARSMALSGFIAYGKPSLVCVECSSAEEVEQFLKEAKRVGKEGSLTYVQKSTERQCNNGKSGLQQVKAMGKSGETPDQHAIISLLTAFGLKDKRKEITGK